MNEPLTLGSLFDGIGGFALAASRCGIRPVWASEIEPFPIRVTTRRFPEMKHLGDIHGIHGGEIEPVDIITFGSPCQNLSIAGNRAGLGGEKSSLFFQAIRIIREMRGKTHDRYPRWAVFENVPGALSSCKGGDFRQILESLVRLKDPEAAVPMPEKGKWLHAGEVVGDGYSLAWRILDASKGWGVAQRRRRIFAVLDLDGGCAGSVLFESEGLSGYSPPDGSTRQNAAGCASDGAGETGGHGTSIAFEPGILRRKGDHHWQEVTSTLRADMGDNQVAVAVEYNPTDSRIKLKDDGICQTLCGRMGTGGNQVPLALQAKTYGISSYQSKGMLSDNPTAGIYEADTSRTLDCSGGNPVCHQGGIAIVEPAPTYCMTVGGFAQVCENESTTLEARGYKDPPVVGQPAIPPRYTVRRLIPDECAVLQGYPADWCHGVGMEHPSDDDIAYWQGVFNDYNKAMGKTGRPRSVKQITKWLQNPRSDAAEYKAFGNSVAIPCVHFVLAGIVWAHE